MIRVLIVEDNAVIRRGAAEEMTRSGLMYTLASGGPEALDVMKARADIDAIITDYSMPKMSGIELAKAVKKVYPHIPIILFTSEMDFIGNDKAFRFSVDRIMLKPEELHLLPRAILELLADKQSLDGA